MPRFEDGSYGSLKGIALIGKVLAGRCTMRYTRASVGEGAIPEGRTPKDMDGPAGYVMDARIAAVTNPVDGECQVTVQIKSDSVERGFYATCIVLYAEDPDEGEVPYTYLSLEHEPEWIRPASSIVGKLATFDLIAAVGSVDAVTAVIDPEAIATVGRVEELLAQHDADPDAHAGLLKRYVKAGAPGEPGSAVLLDSSGKIPAGYLPGGAPGQGGAVTLPVTIPSGAWAADPEGHGAYKAEVGCAQSTEAHIPFVSVDASGMGTAERCGLSGVADAGDGVLRFWADTVPEGNISTHVALFGPGSTVDGSVAVTAAVTIPLAAWGADADDSGAYRAEAECVDSTAGHIPFVSVSRESMGTAGRCGLSGIAEAADGALRFWADAVPEGDISVYVVLFGPGTGGSGGGDCTLQPATAERLGGVKIGSGLSAAPDGTISVDGAGLLNVAAAPEADVKEMLDDVFSDN